MSDDASPLDERLEGWKEIASFVKRDESTARRWEREEGLPVRRHEHRKRSSVYAYRRELEAWRLARKPEGARQPGAGRHSPVWVSLAAAGLILFSRADGFRATAGVNDPAVGVESAGLAADSGPEALRTEMLWADPSFGRPHGHVSRDGRFVTYVDWTDGGNLAIRDLVTGESRRLTSTADNGGGDNGGHYALESRISPDGNRVVYSWARGSPAGETIDLRLLSLAGGEPRTVWTPEDGAYASVQDWFPSGDRVAAIVGASSTSQIVTVSTVDGTVRQIRSLEWAGRAPQVRVSPDGRYLAYSRAVSRDVPERDIFLVAVDGSREIPVVQHAAHDELVGWSPGGDHLLFTSDRSSQPGLWAQRVRDGRPEGEAQLVFANVDAGAGLGITDDGALLYSVTITRRRMKLAELDTTTGRFLRAPANVVDRFVGGNIRGAFSPDGHSLAYVSERQGWTRNAIVIRSLESGEEEEIAHDLRGTWRLTWWPDGRRLVVQGQDERGRYGLFDLDLSTGRTELFAETSWGATFTPDGKHILFRSVDAEDESILSYSVADGSVETLPGSFPVTGRFSSSGKWIATIAGQTGTMPEEMYGNQIRLQPVTGGDGRVLWSVGDGARLGRWTTWLPDGTALLVLKEEPEAGRDMWRLWIVPVDGSDPVATELVHEPANFGSIPFSVHPDGKRIVYGEGGYEYQLWALRNLPLDQAD